MNLLMLRRRLILVLLIRKRSRRRNLVKRRSYVRLVNLSRRKRSEYFSLVADLLVMDQERYFTYFRMGPQRFDDLLSRVRPLILHKPNHKIPISAPERLALTLHILASGCSLTSMATRYRMGKSTVSQIFHETCTAIWQSLKDEFLPVPSADKFREISQDFWQMWNFPNCLGAIDGKHVKIKCPPLSGSSFYCYKGHFSVLLMACVDARYKFTFVDVGAYGSDGDPGTFAQSVFGRAILDGTLSVPPPRNLPGTNTTCPYVFVADEAFQLRKNVMRPYPGSQLNDERRIFNYRLSRARRIVENAFGIMTARFRILLTTIECKPDNVDHIIKACIALHNYLKTLDPADPPSTRYISPHFADYETGGQLRPGEWRNSTHGSTGLVDAGNLGSNSHGPGGEGIRQLLVDYFMSDRGAVPWQEVAALAC